jgi:GNAT superfamily N-acetyltransferase
MVLPHFRGSGLGAALLDTAAQAARDRGLRPIVDVVTSYRSAIKLYERSEWKRIGVASLVMPDDERIDE